jgi:AcrR family transcriptional regulator
MKASDYLLSGRRMRYRAQVMAVRDALLDAAIKLFAEAGARGATTRRIAQEAGVNEVTLFRHFRSKDELLEAALAHFAERVQNRPLPAEPVDPRAELLAWCRAHHRELYRRRSFIRKAMSEFEEHRQHCHHGMQAATRIAADLAQYLRRVKTAGLAPGEWDERAAANMLMGAIFSDAMGRDTMPERYPYPMRDAADKYVNLLVSAIGLRTIVAPGRGKQTS